METCLGTLQLNCCLIYLDDIIVFSKNTKRSSSQVESSLLETQEGGTKIEIQWVWIFQETAYICGGQIFKMGVKTDDNKIKVTWEWPTPKTITEVRCFLGFTNHYQWFIYKYTGIPLYHLILGENTYKKNKTIVWDGKCCEDTFRKLKGICTSTLILVYTNFSKPFT